MDKIKVNGRGKHPLYSQLTRVRDKNGLAGPVMWNFEKFVISPDGGITRFRPTTQPDAPEVIAAIESGLAQAEAA
jgi:glutathione peroxidase